MKKEIWITLKNGKRIPLSLLKNKKILLLKVHKVVKKLF